LLVKIPHSVSFEDASSATVGSIALQGVRQCDLNLGESVCVIGLGLLGIFAVQLFKASGIRVIGFDPDVSRCKLAQELGADLCVHEGLVESCASFSNGRGLDAVLITAATKSNAPVTQAGEIARQKGTIVVTGLVKMDIPRDNFYKKELNFKLSLSYGPGRYDSQYEEAGHDYPFPYVRWTEQRNIEAFLNFIADGKIQPAKLITHRFDLANALDAYKLLLGENPEPYLGITLSYHEKPQGISSVDRIIVKTNVPASGGKKVNVGFIGAGNFAKAILLPVCEKNNLIHLDTVCTSTGMNANETAKKFGFKTASTDYNQLLSNDEVDTIFIATRHNSHAKIVCESLMQGKNVFVEKPLCIKENELPEIKEALNNSKSGILTVGYNRRFSPHAALLKEYFSKRNSPMVINYRVNAGYISPDVWIQDIEVGGGRILGEVCHFVDFAGFLIGSRAESVHALSTVVNNTAQIDEDNVSINIRYIDGSLVNILYVSNGNDALSKEYCEVFADGSSGVMDNFMTTKCTGKLGKKYLKGSQAKGFSEEIQAFTNSILEKSKPPIDYDSLFETSLITFNIRHSLQTQVQQSL